MLTHFKINNFIDNFIVLLYLIFIGLKSEYVMQVDWDKCALQELDITATDLSTECLIDLLTRITTLR